MADTVPTTSAGQGIGYLVQNVYRELIINHVRVGRFIEKMALPEEEVVNSIHALEKSEQYSDATSEFLSYLKKNDQTSDYILFLQQLDEEEYEFIPKLLRGEETFDPKTHQEHCRLLQFFAKEISEKVDFQNVYDKLIEGNWMDTVDSELLRNISRNHGRMFATRWLIYYVLPRRKENWLKQFLQILIELDYSDLADLISGESSNGIRDEEMESEISEDDMVGMNIISASGDAHVSSNYLDAPAVTDSDSESMGDNSRPLSKRPRLNNLERGTELRRQNDFNNITENTSSEYSIEDNSLLDVEEDDLVSKNIILTRENVIKPLENRPYQDELASSVSNGSNAIIVAPTGSGKTMVAFKIMQDHLARIGGLGKVAFFANTITLVDQGYELCRGYIGSSIKIMKIVGETLDRSKATLCQLLEKNDIIFMTPDIIRNALDNKNLDSLSIFTLIIFDECHTVNLKHPTNVVMSYYLDQKLEGCSKLPQTVGLTASVGTGKKKGSSQAESAKTHIKGLCARLDATGGIITVKKNKKSLEEYTKRVQTAIQLAEDRAMDDPFERCVENIMDRVNNGMLANCARLEETLKKDLEQVPEKGTMRYGQWLSTLYKSVIQSVDDKDILHLFVESIKHLSVYNKALIISKDCRGSDGLECINTAFSKMYPHQPPENFLPWTIYEESRPRLLKSADDGHSNPKLILLKLDIMETVSETPETKILVLVKTRGLASAILRWMRETSDFKDLNPVIVTGCGESAEKGGMTRPEQISAVKEFKWGKSRVAIATSVAEQGMDFAKCKKVIRYEYVADEIGSLQAKGRASREDDGLCSVITSNPKVVSQEETNLHLEDVMKAAVEDIQNEMADNPRAFLDEIVAIQKSDKRVRDDEKKQSLTKPRDKSAYQINCTCGVNICLSSDIRVANTHHHMVMTPAVADLMTEIPHRKPGEFDNIRKTTKIRCKTSTCTAEWGSGATYRKKRFVLLNLKHLMFTDNDNKRFVLKKWEDIYLQPMTEEDILQYQTPLKMTTNLPTE